MIEFIQGAYNKYEHDHMEWPVERLKTEIETVNELLKIPHRGEQRLSQLALRKSLAEQELNMRGFES